MYTQLDTSGGQKHKDWCIAEQRVKKIATKSSHIMDVMMNSVVVVTWNECASVSSFFLCFSMFLAKQLAWNHRERTVSIPWNHIFGRERLFLGVKEKPKKTQKYHIFTPKWLKPWTCRFSYTHASWTPEMKTQCMHTAHRIVVCRIWGSSKDI